ncbi:hypothetical protein [Kaistia adipata]|uniref:hypothetical protein n=1 Tax=Kaistia adipata TaxID=166954 RepID=UPI0003F974D8|nr:hypothetical protein [Kaistia adipata]
MPVIDSGILTLWREKARGTKLPPSVAAEGQAGLVEEAGEVPPSSAASARHAPSVAPAE